MRLLRLKVLKITVLWVIAAPIALYLALVAANAYSARQSAKLLSSLETVRVGDSGASFLSKLRGCAIERSGSEYTCEKYILPLGFEWASALLWKLPGDWNFTVNEYLWRIGLRPSDVFVTATIDHDLVQKMHVRVILVGRYESLGTMWDLSERVPEYERVASLSDDERRTHMHWFNITSVPGGEGFRIYVTPASTEKERRARHVNPRCLFSFRGCDGLCELLPDAIPVLTERHLTFGGGTGVPRSACDSATQ